VIRLDAVEKEYGTQPVLRGISLDVADGELLSLVGRSGSGKSTLLHIIGGLDRRYRGHATVLGQALESLDDRRLARFRNREVGFVFQAFNLLDHLTAVENVKLPAYFADGPSADDERRALLALERVGIGAKASARPSELSGGQKQRVAIARALFHQPKLLLCDEPTGNLDSETGQQIIELFRALNRDGLTLVIVTHEERVSSVAARVLRLEDGRLVATDEDGRAGAGGRVGEGGRA
jgi:putative ABC transport system ATP-binding protein